MCGKSWMGLLWSGALVLIAVVDWILGPTAEYLNAWEIVRITFLPDKTTGSTKFLFCQDYLGPWALPMGWIFFLVEGILIALIAYGLRLLARYLIRR